MVRDEDIATVSDTFTGAMMTMGNTVDSDAVYISQAQALLLEKSPHGLAAHHIVEGQGRIIAQVRTGSPRRCPPIVLLSIKALLFDGGHHLPIDHERSAVMLTGGDGETEDDQALRPFPRAE